MYAWILMTLVVYAAEMLIASPQTRANIPTQESGLTDPQDNDSIQHHYEPTREMRSRFTVQWALIDFLHQIHMHVCWHT